MNDNDRIVIDLAGKNVLITGGSMGIGYAVAETCLGAGANVNICSRTGESLRAAEDTLQNAFPERQVTCVVGDVSLEADVTRIFAQSRRDGQPLDGVVHCAGIYGPIGKITEVDPAAWFDALRVNLYGSFLVARASCEAMRRRGGRIVLLSGGGAAGPLPSYTSYACAKIGVVRLVESIAQEMAPQHIEINALAPGFVATRLHQQTIQAGRERSDAFYDTTVERLESGSIPPSVAGRAAAFLISDAARGITGKFVAAPYDGWANWPSHIEELSAKDIFTLRRILPADRGSDWQ